MEIGLYCRFRQFVLRGDVNRALMSFSSVCCLCPGPGCALTADNAVIRDDRSIDRRRAEWPPYELDRCVLTRLVRRDLVRGLISSDAF